MRENNGDFTSWPFVLSRQARLLQKALAPWPRRTAPLLEVNCGDGFFLPLIWQSGFDAVATEFDPELRLKAASQPVPNLEIRSARDDDLPFEDDSFDWVILHLRDGEALASARESLRVTRRGLMILFWNSASIPFWCRHLTRGRGHLPANAACFWRVWQQMRSLQPARQTGLSDLGGPMFTWKQDSMLGRINDWSAGPFGAWCIIRLDLGDAGVVTPLTRRIEEAFNPPRALMECSQKKSSINYKNEKLP